MKSNKGCFGPTAFLKAPVGGHFTNIGSLALIIRYLKHFIYQ